MGAYLKRAIQFGTVGGVVVLGALIWRQSTENFFVEACVFSLIALCVAGVGLTEFKASTRTPSVDPLENRVDARLTRLEQRFVADVGAVAGLLKAQTHANTSYSDSLAKANTDLPQLDQPEQVRAVILSLIEENRKIQTRISDLSRNLDASVAKIETLRSSLADANDKALRDPLTALGNRRFFDEKLDEAMLSAASPNDLCLVLCDLDRFKTINDKFGHPVGDMVLKLFSDILTANVQEGETVARHGGEEFAIIVRDRAVGGAAAKADQIRRQLEGKKWVVGASGAPLGAVTASFGVAQLRPSEGAVDFFKRADEALYRAKAEGRNRVVVA